MTRSPCRTPASVPSTKTGMPFEAVTASPSTDTNRQANAPGRKRLATRNGSSAEYSAIMENRGRSRNTASRGWIMAL